MGEIFISYAREDRPLAKTLAEALEREGWSVWWDRTIPAGRRFHQVIEQELDAARCVMVVWSTNSVDSDWVRAEASEGLLRNMLVPVSIDDALPPLVFRQIQTADLSAWNGDAQAAAFRKLAADIAALLGAPPKRTVEPPEAQNLVGPAVGASVKAGDKVREERPEQFVQQEPVGLAAEPPEAQKPVGLAARASVKAGDKVREERPEQFVQQEPIGLAARASVKAGDKVREKRPEQFVQQEPAGLPARESVTLGDEPREGRELLEQPVPARRQDPAPPPSKPSGTAAAKPDNKRALSALILGIASIVCCTIAGPFAWYMGQNEVTAIDAGQSARENRSMAQAGMILGIIGTVLGLIWIVLYGMVVLSGMGEGMQ